MNRPRVSMTVECLLTVFLLLTPVLSVMAEQQEEPARRCIPMHQIDRIEVVNDKTLVFHLHGDRKYVNMLPYRCRGLEHNAFLHETSLASYCDLDVISVLDTSLGVRLGSCPLGKFQVYDPTMTEGH